MNPIQNETSVVVDPNRWKALIRLIPAAIMVVPLGGMEWLFFRYGSPKDLWGAIIFAVPLALSLYTVVAGLWGWFHRLTGQEALSHAAGQIAQLLPDSPLICGYPPEVKPSKAVWTTIPLTLLGFSIYGFAVQQAPLALGLLAASFVAAGAVWYFLFLRVSEAIKQVLTLDLVAKRALFEGFIFQTSFLPQKPCTRKEIPFEQILDCTYYSGSRGRPGSLQIKTAVGRTSLSERIDHFKMIRAVLEGVITLNLANPERHQAYLRSMPIIRVPWYGWLIVTVAVGGLGVLICMLLTKL